MKKKCGSSLLALYFASHLQTLRKGKVIEELSPNSALITNLQVVEEDVLRKWELSFTEGKTSPNLSFSSLPALQDIKDFIYLFIYLNAKTLR